MFSEFVQVPTENFAQESEEIEVEKEDDNQVQSSFGSNFEIVEDIENINKVQQYNRKIQNIQQKLKERRVEIMKLQESILKRHSSIKRFFEILEEIYYCHFFPCFPEFTATPAITYNKFYSIEKGWRMQIFLNKMHTYNIINDNKNFQEFFDQNYIPNNKSNNFLESSLTMIKSLGRKAKSSIEVKLKQSIGNSFKKDDNNLVIHSQNNSLKNLKDFEIQIEKEFNQILKLIKEIRNFRKILDENGEKNTNLYIIENVEDFEFGDAFNKFKNINEEIRSKEMNCLYEIQNKVIIKLKDLKDDLAKALEKLNYWKARQKLRDTLTKDQLDNEYNDYETFQKELKIFLDQFKKNKVQISTEYLEITKKIENIVVSNDQIIYYFTEFIDFFKSKIKLSSSNLFRIFIQNNFFFIQNFLTFINEFINVHIIFKFQTSLFYIFLQQVQNLLKKNAFKKQLSISQYSNKRYKNSKLY